MIFLFNQCLQSLVVIHNLTSHVFAENNTNVFRGGDKEIEDEVGIVGCQKQLTNSTIIGNNYMTTIEITQTAPAGCVFSAAKQSVIDYWLVKADIKLPEGSSLTLFKNLEQTIFKNTYFESALTAPKETAIAFIAESAVGCKFIHFGATVRLKFESKAALQLFNAVESSWFHNFTAMVQVESSSLSTILTFGMFGKIKNCSINTGNLSIQQKTADSVSENSVSLFGDATGTAVNKTFINASITFNMNSDVFLLFQESVENTVFQVNISVVLGAIGFLDTVSGDFQFALIFNDTSGLLSQMYVQYFNAISIKVLQTLFSFGILKANGTFLENSTLQNSLLTIETSQQSNQTIFGFLISQADYCQINTVLVLVNATINTGGMALVGGLFGLLNNSVVASVDSVVNIQVQKVVLFSSIGCQAGIVYNTSLNYIFSYCDIKVWNEMANSVGLDIVGKSYIGNYGLVLDSFLNKITISMNVQEITNVLHFEYSLIGAIGLLQNSKMNEVAVNLTNKTTKFQTINSFAGALIGLVNNSQLTKAIVAGQGEFVQDNDLHLDLFTYKTTIGGLIGLLVESQIESSYTRAVFQSLAVMQYHHGIGDSFGNTTFSREILCLQQAVGNNENLTCVPKFGSAHNSFAINDICPTADLSLCTDPETHCNVDCIKKDQLNSNFANLFRQKVWGLSQINGEMPHLLKSINFQSEDAQIYQVLGWNLELQLLSPITNTPLVNSRYVNLCFGRCNGIRTQVIEWEPNCDYGVISDISCNKVNCSNNNNPCYNGLECASQQCTCGADQQGILCNQQACWRCAQENPAFGNCDRIMDFTFRCQYPKTTVQFPTSGCHDGYAGDRCWEKVSGTYGLCNRAGTSDDDGQCFCYDDSIYFSNDCFRAVSADLGICFSMLNQYRDIEDLICLKCYYNRTGRDCTECPSKYMMVGKACILDPCKADADCLNGGKCLENVTNICKCKSNYDEPFCEECKKGHIYHQNTCMLMCNASTCSPSSGNCLNLTFCECFAGYKGTWCTEYDCGSAQNPCNNLGVCVGGFKCECNALSLLTKEGSCRYNCEFMVNGVCIFDVDSRKCFSSGWILPFCYEYNCSNDLQTELTLTCNQQGQCIDSVCQCQTWAYNNTCVAKFCDHKTEYNIIIEPYIMNDNMRLGGVAFIAENETIINNSCSFFHKGCQCIENVCSCSKGVDFAVNFHGFLAPLQPCVFGYRGEKCIECIETYQLVGDVCYPSCTKCKGSCYYTGTSVQCLFCFAGYSGYDCSSCALNYAMFVGICWEKNHAAHGDCYINGQDTKCNYCYNNFDITTFCAKCPTFLTQIQLNGVIQCALKCADCNGDCYYVKGTIICLKCTDNAGIIGSSCDRCTKPNVIIKGICYVTFNTDIGSCTTKENITACSSCNVGFLHDELTQSCRKPCDVSQQLCQGFCELMNNEIYCTKCDDYYFLYQDKCFEIVDTLVGGICILVDSKQTCICHVHFMGARCDSCEMGYVLLNNNCYVRNQNTNGVCADVGASIQKCVNCNIGFLLLDCTLCAVGYGGSSCNICDDDKNFVKAQNIIGFPADLLTKYSDHCLEKCLPDQCQQGTCYKYQLYLFCFNCSTGYKGDNCTLCETGYGRIGQFCRALNPDQPPELECINNNGFQICTHCAQSFYDNCLVCDSLSYFVQDTNVDKCYPRIRTLIGNYYGEPISQLNGRKRSSIIPIKISDPNEHMCASGWRDDITGAPICDSCNSQQNYHLSNNSCLLKLEPTSMYYHGDCFHPFDSFEYTCSNCDQNFYGASCEVCQSTSVWYQDDCYPRVSKTDGMCISTGGKIKCINCNKDYYLRADQCVKDKQLAQWVIILISVIIVILFIVCAILAGFCTLKKVNPNKYYIVTKQLERSLRFIGFQILFISMAQIISFARAFQDVMEDTFDGYIFVLFLYSLVFSCLLIFFDKAAYPKFIFRQWIDFPLYVILVVTDIAFNFIVFVSFPSDLVQGSALFMVLTAPIALLVFIMVLSFKYTILQVMTIIISVAIAGLTLAAVLIDSAFKQKYFFDGSSLAQLVGIPFTSLLLLVLIVIQQVILNSILHNYSEIEALGRKGIVQATLSGFIFFYRMKQCLAKINDEMIFLQMLIFIGTETIGMIVVKRLSAVEFTINLTTTALWYKFFSAVSSASVTNDFFLPAPVTELVLGCVGLVAIFVGVTLFYVFMNYFHDYYNKSLLKATDKVSAIKENMAQFIEAEQPQPADECQTDVTQYLENETPVVVLQDEVQQSILQSSILQEPSVFSLARTRTRKYKKKLEEALLPST